MQNKQKDHKATGGNKIHYWSLDIFSHYTRKQGISPPFFFFYGGWVVCIFNKGFLDQIAEKCT